MKTDIASVTTAIFSAAALLSFVLAADIAIKGLFFRSLACIAAGLALTGFAYKIHNNRGEFGAGGRWPVITVYIGFIVILLALALTSGLLVVAGIVCITIGLKLQEKTPAGCQKL